MGAIVTGNPAATVMISSPGFNRLSPSFLDVSVLKAIRFADDPELTSMASETLKYSANRYSNSSAYLPAVNQKSKEASTKLTNSLSSKTRPAYLTGVLPGIKVLSANFRV